MVRYPAEFSASSAFPPSGVIGATVATTAGAPLTTRISRPASTAIASAILTAGSNGVKRVTFGEARPRLLAAIVRITESIGSWPSGELASAAKVRTSELVTAGLHRTNRAHDQFIAGQRAGLVAADHVDHGCFVQRRQSGEQDAFQRERPRAQGGGKRECRRQRDGHRRQQRRQDEQQDLLEADSDRERISHKPGDNDEIVHREIANDTEHGLLLGALDVGDAHQLRRPPEIGARSRRRYPRDRPAATNEASSESGLPALHFGRDRFSGQHGLIEQQRAVDDEDVGGHDVPE